MQPIAVFEKFVKEQGMFFQYPARTEEAFYKMQDRNSQYMPVPWATIIDKRGDLQRITNAISSVAMHCKPRPTETCCQHIHWRKLLPTLKIVGITKLYTPHKQRGEDYVDGVKIVACPLFAVNIEDPRFSIGGHDGPRHLLYSFVGAYAPHYISRVRMALFEMPHPPDAVVFNIGIWHLEQVVYSRHQGADGHIEADEARDARTLEYNKILGSSSFSLCPSGAGPNSIRFWESLAAGAVPVILADGMSLPNESDPIWDAATVRIEERHVHTLEKVLRQFTDAQVLEKRAAARAAYAKYGLRLAL
jgi:Exostosin family